MLPFAGVTFGRGILTLVAVPVTIVLVGITVIGLLLAVPATSSFPLYLLAAGAAGTALGGLLWLVGLSAVSHCLYERYRG